MAGIASTEKRARKIKDSIRKSMGLPPLSSRKKRTKKKKRT